MGHISCIIVEDEGPVRDELQFILKSYSRIKIIGTFNNGIEALEFIKKNEVDLIFLDINIPGINGIAVAEELKKFVYKGVVIFVTSYEDYAIKAFELEAMDYVLKPFDERRIAKSINRVEKQFQQKDISLKSADEESMNTKIFEMLDEFEKQKRKIKKFPCELYGRTIFLDIDEVYFCFTLNEHTYVKTKDNEYNTMFTLSEIEEKTDFFRIHRSFIVNIKYVKELFPLFNYHFKIVMSDNEKTEIPVSRNKVKDLKRLLGL
jgi:two-component system, LytTR family, response regulator LytT